MFSIQRLRTSASNSGNLQSTPQQQVVNDGGNIEIVPADPQVIYVPVYQPDQVYYQNGYGSPFITFGIGFPIGLWLDYDFDWGNNNLIVWGYGHPRPSNWWHESSRQRDTGHAAVWRSNNHPGAVGANRGDRGYDVPQYRSGAAAAGRSRYDSTAGLRTQAPAARMETPATRAALPVARPEVQADRASTPVARPSQAPVQHSQPVSRQESGGAFIGIQSSQDARNYSNRGQQSMQAATHSAPVSHSAPVTRSAPPGGGGSSPRGGGGGGGGNSGGGGHSSGSQKQH
jgi:hypothetical protein